MAHANFIQWTFEALSKDCTEDSEHVQDTKEEEEVCSSRGEKEEAKATPEGLAYDLVSYAVFTGVFTCKEHGMDTHIDDVRAVVEQCVEEALATAELMDFFKMGDEGYVKSDMAEFFDIDKYWKNTWKVYIEKLNS